MVEAIGKIKDERSSLFVVLSADQNTNSTTIPFAKELVSAGPRRKGKIKVASKKMEIDNSEIEDAEAGFEDANFLTADTNSAKKVSNF